MATHLPRRFKTDNPSWEVVIDLDALAEVENGGGSAWFSPSTPAETTLHFFIPWGADADIKREFNTETKTFVEGGFYLPEGRVESLG